MLRHAVFLGLAASAAVAAAAAIAVLRDRPAPTTSGLPPCAQPATTIARPELLPKQFRFPAGTVFTTRYQNVTTHGVPQVEGRMPLDIAAADRFLERDLPSAGFTVNVVRTEPARALLALYSVTGFSGKFRVNALRGCDGATAFAVSARPELLGKNMHAE